MNFDRFRFFFTALWQQQIITFCICIIFFSFIWFLRRKLIKHLETIFFIDSFDLRILLLEILKKTKIFFIIAVSCFCGLSINFFSKNVFISDSVFLVINKIIFLLVMIQVGMWSNAFISFWFDRYTQSRVFSNMSHSNMIGLISFLGKCGVFSFLAIVVLKTFGVDVTTLVAGLGLGGIALALAVQNILGDLFASLTILVDKPFVIGDNIVIDDFQGSVEKIGLKTTRIRSITGEQLIFPNGDLIKSRIKNFKRMAERRITFYLYLAYQNSVTSCEEVQKIIEMIIQSQEMARFERATLKELTLHAINFEVVYWSKQPELIKSMHIHHQIQLDILKKFQKNDIYFAHILYPLFSDNTARISQ